MSDELRTLVHGVLLAAFDGTAVPDWVRDAHGLAGVCLFATNTPDAGTTARLVADLRAAHPDLLVTVDEEGGDVTRIEAATGSSLPGAAAYGAIDDPGATHQAGRALGELLRACGIDLTLAPVVDIASNPDNAVLGARAIAADPQTVARHGVAFVEGLHAAGVGACAKHAPGHGDPAVDSHVGVPTLDADLGILDQRELVPFRAAIDAGVDAIMLAHLIVPALSDRLTSLDPAVPQLLRDSGFTGALITDALDMGAVLERTDGDIGEAAVQALLAGADLLCLGSPAHIDQAAFEHAVGSVVAAVESGRLARDRLEDARTTARALCGGPALTSVATGAPTAAPPAATAPAPSGAAPSTAAPSGAVPSTPAPSGAAPSGAAPSTAAAVSAALSHLRDVGADLAHRAASSRGDVALRPGDGLLDLRFRAAYAASSTHAVMPTVLTERVGLVLGEPSGRRVAVLTKDRSPEVGELLARRPDAVVIHVGFPTAAPQAANIVLAMGGGRASAEEAARMCAPETSQASQASQSNEPSQASEPSQAGEPDGWQSLIGLRSPTEERNPRTTDLDTLDSAGLIEAVLTEDATVAAAVTAAAEPLARLVDRGVAALAAGGRVHYVGAGTSGRLGAIDAAELLPTYGVGTEGFVAHLAGGPAAMLRAVEGAEDDDAAGAAEIEGVGPHDLVVGVAASGRTPYVGGALRAAHAAGAATALISTNPHATLADEVDVAVLIDTGPEVVTGSTRMKAGTATKMAINAFSTAVMVRMGKTYGNLMIDVAPTNEKLRARCVRMLVQATGASETDAAAALAEAGEIRVALVMLGAGVGAQAARDALVQAPTDPGRISDPGGIRTATELARDAS